MVHNKKNTFRVLSALLVCGWLLATLPGCEEAPPGRFVVVVVMDTVRRDALGCYGYPGDPSPAIDAIAGQGVRFERAIATSGWTLPSVASLLTSTWPTIHGALGRGTSLSPLRPEVSTVAEAMSAAGYRTAAYANAAFVSPLLGLDRGFDQFDHVYTFNESARRADETVDAAIAYARSHSGDDCFILVHLFDPHLDYDPPGEYATRFTGGRSDPLPPLSIEDCLDMRSADDAPPPPADIEYIRAVYQGEVAFMDAQIGRLADALKTAGVYERSLMVVTSDHGEEFWEHGDFEHGHTLYDELVGVPLVIKFPADLHPVVRVVKWQVPLIDVMPTVLDYLAIERPASFEGESLLSFVRGEPRGHRNVLSESLLYGTRRIAWRTPSYVYIQDIEEGRDDVGQMFNWRTDPGENNDLSRAEPENAAQLRDECMAFYMGLLERAQTMSKLKAVDMSPEEIEKLRSLGYVR